MTQLRRKLELKGSHETKKSLSSTKGQILQVAYLMTVLLACALTILTVKYIYNRFDEAIREGGYNTTQVQAAQNRIMLSWEQTDYGFLIVTVGLFIVLIITSFMIPTHPVFIVVNVFGIFFLVFIGMITSGLYGQIVAGQDAVFSVEAETFTIMNFIMSYLPFIAAGIIFITSIVMFVRGANQV